MTSKTHNKSLEMNEAHRPLFWPAASFTSKPFLCFLSLFMRLVTEFYVRLR